MIYAKNKTSYVATETKRLKNIECGICPECFAMHTEAAFHPDIENFWTEFRCPECMYFTKVHIAVEHKDVNNDYY